MAKSKTVPGTEPEFETGFAELETIVAALERDELNLEAALERFERGVALVKTLRGRLDTAERRVTELVGDDDERPFADDE